MQTKIVAKNLTLSVKDFDGVSQRSVTVKVGDVVSAESMGISEEWFGKWVANGFFVDHKQYSDGLRKNATAVDILEKDKTIEALTAEVNRLRADAAKNAHVTGGTVTKKAGVNGVVTPPQDVTIPEVVAK